MRDGSEPAIGIIGLGYVGLPLAVAFGKMRAVIGFDINQARIAELVSGNDTTGEASSEDLLSARNLTFTYETDHLQQCGVFIVTVPTPVDEAKKPDLTLLRRACSTVGEHLKEGNTVIFESTVYPGCTNGVCVPILEAASGLQCNRDFFVAYSPERINPGDKQHQLSTITKIVSGSTPETLDFVDRLYGSVVTAGTHRAPSIEVAEAAKVIENTQRDLNIALMNELSIIFHRLGVETHEVLEAAGTKWNFLPFKPGLVGGHCIGIDPYYLTHRAQEIGYQPEVILAGRRINDGMGGYVANRVSRLMMRKRISVVNSRVLVLGLTFKEDCPDLRNSKVADVIAELRDMSATVEAYDPWASAQEVQRLYGDGLFRAELEDGSYDAIVLSVPHRQFREWGSQRIRALGKQPCVIFDVKSVLPAQDADERL